MKKCKIKRTQSEREKKERKKSFHVKIEEIVHKINVTSINIHKSMYIQHSLKSESNNYFERKARETITKENWRENSVAQFVLPCASLKERRRRGKSSTTLEDILWIYVVSERRRKVQSKTPLTEKRLVAFIFCNRADMLM